MAKIDLKPGERARVRTPPLWVGWFAILATLAMPAAILSLYYFDDDGRMRDAVWVLYVLGGFTALQLLSFVPMLRWRIMATDRRVFVRHGFLKRELEEIDREDIEAVRQEEMSIAIKGGGRIIETPCFPLFAGRLLAVIDPARAASEGHAGATGGLPGPGEDVLLRPKSQLPAKLFSVVAATLPFGATMYWMVERAGPPGPADWALVLAMPTAMALVFGAIVVGMVRSQKQWLITGQRIMTVQGIFRRRVEDIRLDWIENTAFDGATLTVKGGGRTLDIPLDELATEDLQRVLGRWFPWQGAPMRSARALLHDGETLLLRRPRRWMVTATVAMPLLALAALAGYVLFRLAGERAFFVMLPALLGMVLLLPLFPRAIRDAAWSLMVTDRRILLRRRHDHRRYDELPLGEIEDLQSVTKHRPRVTFSAQGRQFEIPALSAKAADRIRETIEQAKEAGQWRA